MLPLMCLFMMMKKNNRFSWWPIKNDSVTPYVFFHEEKINKNHADDKKRQCYPLRVFSWWRKKFKKFMQTIKNDSVTPYVFFYDDEKKASVFMTNDKKRQWVFMCFFIMTKKSDSFSWRPIKHDSYPLWVFSWWRKKIMSCQR